MSYINLESEFSVENCETLGPKIQKYHNCNLRVVGGALREAVDLCAIFSPNVSILSVGTPKKERVVRIFGNPRRAIRFWRKEDNNFEGLCNGFFKTYALIPC
jgi:hypothetical protein